VISFGGKGRGDVFGGRRHLRKPTLSQR
jgi:hypothetical protein